MTTGIPDIRARSPGDVVVRFEGVRKAFGAGARRNAVYEDLALEIRKGEVLTIMGGSGTGKSVLLKLLVGLLKPDAGRILVDGIDIAGYSEDDLLPVRRQIGMVFQGAALFDSLSVYENVAYPLREHFSWPEERISQTVAEKLALVGLPGVEKMRPGDLSGGMRKRVGLARALATGADVILYDEPTTGLDPTNTRRINELIQSVNEKLGVTSVVVTHDMQSAFEVSDRLAMLWDRRIVWTGSVDEARAGTD
ncbi:MAG TPA: ATP-binding cassette domain-containing protein, partial [bacterium]|nr:ATP-binding cassette domain-containing protein [bacterium]